MHGRAPAPEALSLHPSRHRRPPPQGTWSGTRPILPFTHPRSAINERSALEDAKGFRLAGRILLCHSIVVLLLKERLLGAGRRRCLPELPWLC